MKEPIFQEYNLLDEHTFNVVEHTWLDESTSWINVSSCAVIHINGVDRWMNLLFKNVIRWMNILLNISHRMNVVFKNINHWKNLLFKKISSWMNLVFKNKHGWKNLLYNNLHRWMKLLFKNIIVERTYFSWINVFGWTYISII